MTGTRRLTRDGADDDDDVFASSPTELQRPAGAGFFGPAELVRLQRGVAELERRAGIVESDIELLADEWTNEVAAHNRRVRFARALLRGAAYVGVALWLLLITASFVAVCWKVVSSS